MECQFCGCVYHKTCGVDIPNSTRAYCYLCYHYSIFLDEYVVLEEDQIVVDASELEAQRQRFIGIERPPGFYAKAQTQYIDKLLLSYGLPDHNQLAVDLRSNVYDISDKQQKSIDSIMASTMKLSARTVFAQVVGCQFVPAASNAIERGRRDCFHVIAFYKTNGQVVQVSMAVEYPWLHRFLPISLLAKLLQRYKYGQQDTESETETTTVPGFYWFEDDDWENIDVPILIPLDIWKIVSVSFKTNENSDANLDELCQLFREQKLTKQHGTFRCIRQSYDCIQQKPLKTQTNLSQGEIESFPPPFIQQVLQSANQFCAYSGVVLREEGQRKIQNMFNPAPDERIVLKYRLDNDTCAVSSFACAMAYVAENKPSVKATSLWSIAGLVHDSAMNDGGGCFNYHQTISTIFRQHNKEIWSRFYKVSNCCILEYIEKNEDLFSDGSVIFSCQLMGSDGSQSHIIAIYNGFIFDNNFPNAIKLNKHNLSLCTCLGDFHVDYVGCLYIKTWKFGFLEPKHVRRKRRRSMKRAKDAIKRINLNK